MTFSTTSTRSVLSAVALASALTLGSSAAMAAPTLQVGRTAIDGNAPAQVASAGDPSAFSRIAHEQSAPDHAALDQARAASAARTDRAADPTAFGARAHEHNGADASARPTKTDHARDMSTHADHRNQHQQPNQAWAG